MNLTDWRRLSYRLSAELHSLELEFRRFGATALADEAAGLRERVEARRFNVAVVGDFRRGKSTFLNALLGRAVLPSDVAPTTATVNRVTYGARPSVLLHFHDGRPSQLVPWEQLAAHVTKLSDESADRAATIREAEITFPVRFCKNDIDLFDTPGLGDEAAMTAVTMGLLTRVDAAILVIMADSPFSSTEADFLDQLYSEGVSEVLFVVTALDRIRRSEDRTRVIESIRGRISARLVEIARRRFAADPEAEKAFLARHGTPRLYGVSALIALEARELEAAEGERLIAQSGMPEFEGALERFLAGSDSIGLRRRFEQAASLCEVFQAETPPLDAPMDPTELARIEALLDALERAIDLNTRNIAGLCARAVSSVETRLTSFRLQKALPFPTDLDTHWPSAYPAFLAKMALAFHEAIAELVRGLLPVWRVTLADELGALQAEQERLVRVHAYVAKHISERLRGAAVAGASDGDVILRLADAPEFSAIPVVDVVTPSAEAILELIVDPAIERALHAANRLSFWDRVAALDTDGLDEKWFALAAPKVFALVGEHVTSERVGAAVREHVELLRAGWVARLEPSMRHVRRLRAEVATARGRAELLRQERERERDRVEASMLAMRTRLLEAASSLG